MTRTPQASFREYFLLFCILAVTIVVFSPVLHFTFTNWDDDIHITNNPAIQNLSLKSIGALFLPGDKYMYHPLTMFSYMIEWNIAGQQSWIFHGTNVLLHCINVCLVFFLMRQLCKNSFLIALTTVVFALHPLQVESVAWISSRKDLLSGLCMLATVLFYYRWKDSRDLKLYMVSMFMFVLSLLSKPSSVVVPLVLIILDISEQKKISWSLFKDKFAFIALAGIFTLFIVSTSVSHSPLPFQFYSTHQKISLILFEIGFYLVKFIAPVKLSACYSYPVLHEGILPFEYYQIALVTVMLMLMVLIFIVRRNSTAIAFGLLMYCVILAPVLQIVPFNNASLVSDRYAYLAIIGLSFSFLRLSENIIDRVGMKRMYVSLISMIVLGLMVYGSIVRLPVWNDSISLFTDVIAKDSRSAVGYGNRANAKLANGDYEGAREDCNTLISLIPDEPKVYYNRGNAFSELHRTREAVEDYSRSIMLGFRSPNIFYNRGNQYLAMKQFDSAAADYNTVLTLSPAYLGALLQMDYIASVVKHDYPSSLYYLGECIKYSTDDAPIFIQRAQTYAKVGQFGAALHDAAVALSIHGNGDTADKFLRYLNRTIDSINTEVKKITAFMPLKGRSERNRLLRVRSGLYWSLGDSLRAKNDLLLSGIERRK